MKKVSMFGLSVVFLLFTGVLSGYLDLTSLWAAPEGDRQEEVAEQGVSVECLQGFLSDIQECLQPQAAAQLPCVLNSVQALLACLSGPEDEDGIDVSLTDKLQFVLPDGSNNAEVPLVISVGDTVRWTNIGTIFHTVTSGPGSSDPTAGTLFDQSMPGGAVFEFTFTTPGTFPYFCRPHEFTGMKGTVVVNP